MLICLCSACSYAIGRARAGTEIVLKASAGQYRMSTPWISRDIVISGEGTSVTHLYFDNNCTVAPTGSDIIDVTFKRMSVSGLLYIGDTSLTFDSIFSEQLAVVQEHFRRKTVKLFEVSISNSFFNNSIIATRPQYFDSKPQVLFEDCEHANIELFNSDIDTCLVNLTALQVSMRIDDIKFKSTHISLFKNFIGVYINQGFNLARNFSAEPTLSTDGTTYRKKRWTNEHAKSNDALDDPIKQIIKKNGSVLVDLEQNSLFHSDTNITISKSQSIQGAQEYTKHTLKFNPSDTENILGWNDFISPQSDRILHRVRREKSSSSSTSVTSASKGLFKIKNSQFSGLTQERQIGAASIKIFAKQVFDLEIQKSEFVENDRAIDIEIGAGTTEASVYIHHSNFTNNHAYGPGGALHVYQFAGKVTARVLQCVFTSNTADSLRQNVGDAISDSGSMNVTSTNETLINGTSTNGTSIASATNLEVSRITGSGGAIAINVVNIDNTAHIITIESSTFVNNTAKNYGGSLYFTPGVSAKLYYNDLYNVDCVQTENKFCRAQFGDILESRGSMIMKDNTFTAVTASNVIPLVSYRADKDGSFMETDGLSFKCPLGYIVSPLYTSIQISSTRTLIETLLLYCKKCTDNYYTIDASEVQINQAQGLNISDVTTATCLPCPYGAQCDSNRNVKAKTNFWGINSGKQIYMYLCPEGKSKQSMLNRSTCTCVLQISTNTAHMTGMVLL